MAVPTFTLRLACVERNMYLGTDTNDMEKAVTAASIFPGRGGKT